MPLRFDRETIQREENIMNWKSKVIIQFLLSHLPKGEQINYLLQNLITKSHSPEMIGHRIPILVQKLQLINNYKKLEGISVCEIGTGWDAISALLFYLMGAKIIYTCDHIPHVRYKLVKEVINQIGNRIGEIHSITLIPRSVLVNRIKKLKCVTNSKMMFKRANIIYKSPGDATRIELSDNSIDLVFSYAVLEHVSENIIYSLMIETKRILRKNGIVYHAIGLGDHYAGFDKSINKVNFLRYPEWLWSFFIKNKISYHNRLREKEFINIFELHGAKIEMLNNKIDPGDIETLKTMKIDKRFSGMTREELAVNYSDIILSF